MPGTDCVKCAYCSIPLKKTDERLYLGISPAACGGTGTGTVAVASPDAFGQDTQQPRAGSLCRKDQPGTAPQGGQLHPGEYPHGADRIAVRRLSAARLYPRWRPELAGCLVAVSGHSCAVAGHRTAAFRARPVHIAGATPERLAHLCCGGKIRLQPDHTAALRDRPAAAADPDAGNHQPPGRQHIVADGKSRRHLVDRRLAGLDELYPVLYLGISQRDCAFVQQVQPAAGSVTQGASGRFAAALRVQQQRHVRDGWFPAVQSW